MWRCQEVYYVSTWVLAKINMNIDPTGKSTKNIIYRDVLESWGVFVQQLYITVRWSNMHLCTHIVMCFHALLNIYVVPAGHELGDYDHADYLNVFRCYNTLWLNKCTMYTCKYTYFILICDMSIMGLVLYIFLIEFCWVSINFGSNFAFVIQILNLILFLNMWYFKYIFL